MSCLAGETRLLPPLDLSFLHQMKTQNPIQSAAAPASDEVMMSVATPTSDNPSRSFPSVGVIMGLLVGVV